MTEAPTLESLAMAIQQSYDLEELKLAIGEWYEEGWPKQYVNRKTGKAYKPHHDLEARIAYSDTPLNVLAKGGEGSGKSVLGIVKTLDRIKRGMDSVMVSPDFEHFRKLWPEFQRWCPWHRVHRRHRYREDVARIPNQPFLLAFDNDVGTVSTLTCGGIHENRPKAWEGPNVNFVWMDEMRRHTTAIALETLSGRVRIPGPNGEPPQLIITTTPSKHWLFDYFGPMECRCTSCSTEFKWDLAPGTVPTCPNCFSTDYVTEDPWQPFKRKAAVITLRLKDNEENLYEGFAEDRALTLTESQARIRIDAEWEDEDDTERFLPSMTLWDLCRERDIPPLTPNEPLILALDAAKGRTNAYSDCFAIVGVSRHWDRAKRRDHVVVRYVQTWQAKPGKQIDFQGTPQHPGPELAIRNLCSRHHVIQVAYDPHQLHDMGTRLGRSTSSGGLGRWFDEFGQIAERTKADSDLLQLIISRRIVHNGDQTLREHVQNSDRKVSDDGNKLRIVKRLDNLKIDATVALSMACHRCLYLNIA